MLTPAHLLSVIEDADAAEPRGKRRIILELRAPRLLGQHGKYLGHDPERVGPDGALADPGGPVYGYTRRQCLAIRAAILQAAAEDAAAERAAHLDDGFGDGVNE
jgi:hypothetical protein